MTTENGKTREQVMGLVKKLLNMSVKNGATEAEATVAMEKAQKLMFEYHLEMETIEDYQAPDKGASKITSDDMMMSAKDSSYKEWRIGLAVAIARYNFCQCLLLNRGTGTVTGFTFIGRRTDIDVVKEMLAYITEQAEELANKAVAANARRRTEMKREGNPDWVLVENGQKYKNGFLHGLVVRVRERLRDQWNALQKQTQKSTALVVVTDAAINEYVKNKWPKLGTRSAPRQSFGTGFSQGYSAGNNVSFARAKQVAATMQLR